MIPNVFQCTCMSDWARVKNVFVDTKTGLNGLNYVFYLFFMIKIYMHYELQKKKITENKLSKKQRV